MNASQVLSPVQALLAVGLAAGLGVALWWGGLPVAIVLNTAFVAAVAIGTLWRLSAMALGLVRSASPASPADGPTPTFTVLVPMYREERAVGGLVEHLAQLDYPADRLQILLLIEVDDAATAAAAEAAVAEHGGPDRPAFRVVIVPDGRPRTKPRACNHGLTLATGELLVIFDAEDRPEPDQLRKAAAAFAAAGPELLCVQARLDCYNRDRSWLTRLFTCEYTAWFASFLPGLERLRAPLPLGGTSNHMRSTAVRELGGWDPWNVAEDCDLGMRIAQSGHRTGTIDSTTWEESTASVGPWLRQRSRWCKGWAQTWLVALRSGWAAHRRLGLLGSLQMHLLLGSTVLGQLITPPCYLLTVLWFTGLGEWMRGVFPPMVTAVGVALLLLGNAAGILLGMLACLHRRHASLVPWCLLLPVVWFLAGLAAWRGVLQLITRPFHWEKTDHAVEPQPSRLPTASGGAVVDQAAAPTPPAEALAARSALRPGSSAPPAASGVLFAASGVPLWWGLAALAITVALAWGGADHGPCAILRAGTLADLGWDLDRGRQALVASPWLLPLPTALMLPFVILLPWLPLAQAYLAMNAVLLASAALATARLLGGDRWWVRLLAIAAVAATAAALAPTTWADLLPALAFCLIAMRLAASTNVLARAVAGPAWTAAAGCHPVGLLLALLALGRALCTRRRQADSPAMAWLHAAPLAYGLLVLLLANWLIMRTPFATFRAWDWPADQGSVATARQGLDQLSNGELAGRAVVVAGPLGYLVGEVLAASEGHHVIDLQPGPVAPWETREQVLLQPAPGSPLRRWSDPLHATRLGLVFIRATPDWLIWAMPGSGRGDALPAGWQAEDQTAAPPRQVELAPVPVAPPPPPSDTVVLATATPPALDAAWDSPDWKWATEVELATFLPRSVFKPKTRLKMLHDRDTLYLRWMVEDQWVKATARTADDPTYYDTCVEAFLQPPGQNAYFAIETSCNGTLNLNVVEDPRWIPGKGLAKTRRLRDPDLTDIRIVTSLPRSIPDEIKEPVTWHLGLSIPLGFLTRHLPGTTLTGIWRGNFYKASANSSHPHWVSWKSIGGQLNFHQPWFFGTIRFDQ